jgi:hypothetical protein
MVERRSISSIHAQWRLTDTPGSTGSWYIETHNTSGEVLAASSQKGWDGPAPQRYQEQDGERLRTDLQAWEPEARIFMQNEMPEAGPSANKRGMIVW